MLLISRQTAAWQAWERTRIIVEGEIYAVAFARSTTAIPRTKDSSRTSKGNCPALSSNASHTKVVVWCVNTSEKH